MSQRKRRQPETLEDIAGELVRAGRDKAHRFAEDLATEAAQQAIDQGKKKFRNTIKGLMNWADKNIK